jgi:hypothetical protein
MAVVPLIDRLRIGRPADVPHRVRGHHEQQLTRELPELGRRAVVLQEPLLEPERWQVEFWMGVPVAALTWARKRPDSTRSARDPI